MGDILHIEDGKLNVVWVQMCEEQSSHFTFTFTKNWTKDGKDHNKSQLW